MVVHLYGYIQILLFVYVFPSLLSFPILVLPIKDTWKIARKRFEERETEEIHSWRHEVPFAESFSATMSVYDEGVSDSGSTFGQTTELLWSHLSV